VPYPHCSFTVVIYTFFQNKGTESYRKESSFNLVVSVRANPDFRKVKLPCHRAGLPGNVMSFYECPFLPAGRQGHRPLGGACGALAGHKDREFHH